MMRGSCQHECSSVGTSGSILVGWTPHAIPSPLTPSSYLSSLNHPLTFTPHPSPFTPPPPLHSSPLNPVTLHSSPSPLTTSSSLLPPHSLTFHSSPSPLTSSTVASHSAAFLDSIAAEAVFDVEEINNALYDYVPELSEVRVRPHSN